MLESTCGLSCSDGGQEFVLVQLKGEELDVEQSEFIVAAEVRRSVRVHLLAGTHDCGVVSVFVAGIFSVCRTLDLVAEQ